jgi:hypothetical protein
VASNAERSGGRAGASGPGELPLGLVDAPAPLTRVDAAGAARERDDPRERQAGVL